MTDWIDPSLPRPNTQPPYQPLPNQQPPYQPMPNQPPLPNTQQTYPQQTGQPLLPYAPMPNQAPPYPSTPNTHQLYPPMPNTQPPYPLPPTGQLPFAYQPMPNTQPPYPLPPTGQSPTNQIELRKLYNIDRIRMYFKPFPDRGPKIRELEQKIRELEQKIRELKQKIATLRTQMIGWAVGGFVLLVLLLVSATRGIILLDLLELVGIIGIIARITSLVRIGLPSADNELLVANNQLVAATNELNHERGEDAREKEIVRRVQPPNEYQYDEWISHIKDDFHIKAPEKMHLPEHPEHKAWKMHKLTQEPEMYGASLSMEGQRILGPNDPADDPPMLSKLTQNSNTLRVIHSSIYVFTSLFVTEDYVAIYTTTVNLCDPMRDSERLEYCYHQHLSHMSLQVETQRENNVGTQSPMQPSSKVSTLALTFDSGYKVTRNISTFHDGNTTLTGIDKIHEKLTIGVKAHERSMVRSFDEANGLREAEGRDMG